MTGQEDLDYFVEVKSSPIHGRGVFARRDIAAGVHIGDYEGPRVAADDIYVLWIDCDEEGVYGIDGQNALRFVNHAPRPNASFQGEQLITLRPIAAGEEITFHYGEEWADLDEALEMDDSEAA